MEEFTLNPRRSSSPFGCEQCLCHKEGIKGSLTKFTNISWNTFQKAAAIRRDNYFKNLEEHWHNGPFGSYHRACYQSYTHKDHLERIKSNDFAGGKTVTSKEFIPQCENISPPRKRLSRSELNGSDLAKCIICQSEKRTKTNRRSLEPLTQCLTEQASLNLLTAAEIRQDQHLLLSIRDEDCIAIEVKYHNSCYRDYTHKKTLAAISKNRSVSDDSPSAYDAAFDLLAQTVQDNIIDGLKVMSMSNILANYLSFLQSEGIHAPHYHSEKLKDRLIKRFGGTIGFWHPRYRSEAELVYSDSVPKGQIIEAGIKSSSPQDIHDSSINEDMIEDQLNQREIFHCAKTLRKLLLGSNPMLSWPPSLDNITTENVNIPDIVFNFLVWLISQEDSQISSMKIQCPDHIHRKVMSIGQDLIFAVTKGKIKTPKHVSLPMTIKNLTGSTQVVTILNRLGHSVSLTQLQEMETAMAIQELEKSNPGLYLPPHIEPHIFTTFCWDNNDFQEETLSGKGTTHCTNGIAIQRQVHGCALPINPAQQVHKRKRSINPPPSFDDVPYNAGKRKGPQPIPVSHTGLHESADDTFKLALQSDFGWLICRLGDITACHLDSGKQQIVPGWSAFNSLMRKKQVPQKSVVGYCQVVNASPTDLTTVQTVLMRSQAMADQLDQKDTVIVFDQAIYAKAQEIIWKTPDNFQNIVLRLGAFHICCTFLAVIGKRFGDGGLSDLLIESQIVASGSVTGVLEGRHYNRAVRLHKIVMEAMFRMRWNCFIKWLVEFHSDADLRAIQSAVHIVCNYNSAETFDELLTSQSFQSLFNLYKDFCQVSNGPTAAFWNSYMDMVQLLLCFIRATREGNWELHLACIKSMMPWIFAYNRTNYARYLPVYWCEMKNLHATHPEANRNFYEGEFAVQRSLTNGFGQVAVDQTIEQTLNRHTKTKGGITGFSINKSAVHRWMITAHMRASVTQRCFEMAGIKETVEEEHKEARQPRICRDEEDVRKVYSLLSNWVNPFSQSENLYHLASGVTVSEDSTKHILDAFKVGQKAAMEFIQERIESNSVDFHAPLPKNKLHSFNPKSSRVKVQGKEIIIKADRNLFARLLVIAQTRALDLKDVLRYELGPVPWSLATLDGTPAKTMKSKMQALLQKHVDPAEEVPASAVKIIDFMAVLQSIVATPQTFGALANVTLQGCLKGTHIDSRVDIVADQYPTMSIKDIERTQRAKTGTLLLTIKSSDQRCPQQWKKFLSNARNKIQLMQFLTKEWADDKYADMIGQRQIFVTCGENCQVICLQDGGVSCQIVEELCSTQEEADTRLFLHARHASQNGHYSIVIQTPDTDVHVLAYYYEQFIPAKMYISTGNQMRTHFVDVTAIAESIGKEICQALPGLHAFTGCDSVSAFVGLGKKKALDLVSKVPELCCVMQDLGKDFRVTEALNTGCEQFVCALYGKPGNDIDSLRYTLFCGQNLQSHKLPPTKDALIKHVKRANFQAAIWKMALESRPSVPCPTTHGWIVQNGSLRIDWMSNQPAPSAVLEFITCGCGGVCDSKRCSCKKSGLSCTDACHCGDNCTNKLFCQSMSSDDSEEE